MKAEYKEGDKVIATVAGEEYKCHIEERLTTKRPSKKTALFVCFDGTPRMPIQLENFLKFYGSLKKVPK